MEIIEIGKAQVQFTDPDNFKHEKVYRLIFAKLAGIVPNLINGLDTALTDVKWSDIAKELLADKDLEFIRNIMWETTTVDDLPLKSQKNASTIMNKYGFFMYNRIFTEAVRHYLGEHWNLALENGCIPESLTQMWNGFMEKYQTVRALSGQQLKEDTQTTETQ